MPYQKAKDIFIQRKNSDGKFEEFPFVVAPNSVVVTDAANNLTMSLISSFGGGGNSDSASWESSSLQTQNSTQSIYANSSSWVSASVRITTADTASYVSASAIGGTPSSAISASHALVADLANAINFVPQTAAISSWSSSSLSASWAPMPTVTTGFTGTRSFDDSSSLQTNTVHVLNGLVITWDQIPY